MCVFHCVFSLSFCGGITARWKYPPSRREYLLGHMHVSKDKNSFWEGGILWNGAVEVTHKRTTNNDRTEHKHELKQNIQ